MEFLINENARMEGKMAVGRGGSMVARPRQLWHVFACGVTLYYYKFLALKLLSSMLKKCVINAKITK